MASVSSTTDRLNWTDAVFNVNQLAFPVWSYLEFPHTLLPLSSVHRSWSSRLWPVQLLQEEVAPLRNGRKRVISQVLQESREIEPSRSITDMTRTFGHQAAGGCHRMVVRYIPSRGEHHEPLVRQLFLIYKHIAAVELHLTSRNLKILREDDAILQLLKQWWRSTSVPVSRRWIVHTSAVTATEPGRLLCGWAAHDAPCKNVIIHTTSVSRISFKPSHAANTILQLELAPDCWDSFLRRDLYLGQWQLERVVYEQVIFRVSCSTLFPFNPRTCLTGMELSIKRIESVRVLCIDLTAPAPIGWSKPPPRLPVPELIIRQRYPNLRHLILSHTLQCAQFPDARYTAGLNSMFTAPDLAMRKEPAAGYEIHWVNEPHEAVALCNTLATEPFL